MLDAETIRVHPLGMQLHDPTEDPRGAEAPASAARPAAPPAIIDLTIANFEREALVRSRELPVLIDFWATWCGPCKTLTPVLEKLAREFGGRVVLAKVDIDKNPELSEAFRIQSVPTVVLLVGGRPVDAFMGVQPEKTVRAFLEPHLPPPASSVIEKVAALEAEGRYDDAIAILRAHLGKQPADGAARIALGRALLAKGDSAGAKKAASELTPADLATEAGSALQAQLAFQANAGDLDALAAKVAADPKDIGAHLAYGKALVAAGRREEGLEELWKAARGDLHHDGDAPRKALIEVFGLLGFDDPLTLEYQRRLSMLLTA
jgi:putative thioredoxin